MEEERVGATLMDILETALKREEASYHFYDRILQETTADLFSETIEQLREEEYRHIRIIEKMIEELRSG